MNKATILSFLSENPGSIASEIGVTPVVMSQLEQAGEVVRLGARVTGKRGRPPLEWAVPGANVKQDSRVAQVIQAAKQRVEDHRQYMRDYDALSRLRQQEGLRSPVALEAKAEFRAKWPTPPALPTGADYAAIGVVSDISFVEAA